MSASPGVDPVASDEPCWQLWVDTGGTFTDCVAIDPAGDLHRAKVLSSSILRARARPGPGPHTLSLIAGWDLPDDFFCGSVIRRSAGSAISAEVLAYDGRDRILHLEAGASIADTATGVEIVVPLEAPILAAHWVTRTPLGRALPPVEMRLATTRGTNALLERRGTPILLLASRGFGDLLLIGTQQRPDIFALRVERPRPLYAEVLEVDERLSADGEVLRPLDTEALRPRCEELLRRGIRVAAVALLHSYRNPQHEEQLNRFLLDLGFDHVSCSHRLAPRIKLLPRTETAVVNAYLFEVIETYVQRVRAALAGGSIRLLTSAGSLVSAEGFLPKDSLLSGPAGGVLGAVSVALRSGFERCLAFDMGGTSTDVSRYDGVFDYTFDTRVGDAHLLAPSLAVESVAAGGGSICRFDGRQLKVGPESAGAAPGPACYGAGGPLTLTDVNLLLGRLDPGSFEIPIDESLAARALQGLRSEMPQAQVSSLTDEELLNGLLDIANERMAEAVRRISIRRGFKPADHALVAFGGAGGQHACALAEILGVKVVLVPEDAGLLSAVGLGTARVERFVERQVLQPLSEVAEEIPVSFSILAEEARAAVSGEGVDPSTIRVRHRLLHLRLLGQESSLIVEFDEAVPLQQAFAAAYEDHYGYHPGDRPVELESMRVIAASGEDPARSRPPQTAMTPAHSEASRRAFFAGKWLEVPVYRREALRLGDRLPGPALVFEQHCATVVPPTWRAHVDGVACLVLRRG